ncbi:MAG: amphi-Trp domain-containing protein [Halonotius sp.]|jgi:amphi-Trp domain-containing protein
MPEEIRFKSESTQSREAIATYLRSVADKLDGGGSVTLTAGDETTNLEIPAQPTFEVKAERETDSHGGNAEQSLELEIEWDEDGNASGEGGALQIE